MSVLGGAQRARTGLRVRRGAARARGVSGKEGAAQERPCGRASCCARERVCAGRGGCVWGVCVCACAAWVRAPGLRASTRVCAGGLHRRVPGGVRVQAGRARACVPVRRCGPPLCHSEAG